VPRSKNEWSYTATPQYAFLVWPLVKAQGKLYIFTFNIKVFLLRYELNKYLNEKYN